MPWKDITAKPDYKILTTNLGKIAILEQGEKVKPVIILLHGCPSDSEEFYHWYPSLLYTGYRVIGIDQPGYGQSPGPSKSHRSENNLDKGGPVDVVAAVMENLGIEKAVIAGYDWGAGIALSFCIKFPKKVEKIVAFMPSYNEKNQDELKTVSKPCLIEWVKQDQFHIWNKWKKLADKISNKTIE